MVNPVPTAEPPEAEQPQKIPPQSARQDAIFRETVVQTAMWSSPLPPPSALEHFERVVPGSAERIFRMAEQEQAHRHELERKSLEGASEQSRVGNGFGVMVALLAIVGAIISVFVHAPWEATVAFVGVPMLGIVRAFIRGRDSNTKT